MCDKVMPEILFMFSSHLPSFPSAFGGFATSRHFVVADDFVHPINWDGPQAFAIPFSICRAYYLP
jgi:hypothetical protein